jgi:serine/threonine-protein kinase RsbW
MQPTVQTLDIRNDLAEVERVNTALRDLWVRCALPEDFEAPVAICLEEILSNVIRHGCVPDGRLPGEACDIQVRWKLLDGARGGIEVEVSDNGKEFNPLSLPAPDVTAPLEERKAGGLGVFMVRNMMDEVHYDRSGGRNRFVFRKRWGKPAEGSG